METANLGLFQAMCSDISKQIQPVHQKHVNETEGQLLQIYRSRSVKLRSWLELALSSLSGGVTEIEQFVERKNALDRIYREQSKKKDDLLSLD